MTLASKLFKIYRKIYKKEVLKSTGKSTLKSIFLVSGPGTQWRRGESNPYLRDATAPCSRYTTPPRFTGLSNQFVKAVWTIRESRLGGNNSVSQCSRQETAFSKPTVPVQGYYNHFWTTVKFLLVGSAIITLKPTLYTFWYDSYAKRTAEPAVFGLSLHEPPLAVFFVFKLLVLRSSSG